MEAMNINVDYPYNNAFQATSMENNATQTEKEISSDLISSSNESKIHNSAVNVSISMESLKVFLNIKSIEMNQANSLSQSSLINIINNTEVYDFLSGQTTDEGFSLSSIGYTGKPISQLNTNEAKELVSENGFFGITQTSQRVSSFAIGLADDNIEALQEVRKGIVQGFEEAEKMWGGELPEISYETQKKTLEIIDEKINELLKTDSLKELDEIVS